MVGAIVIRVAGLVPALIMALWALVPEAIQSPLRAIWDKLPFRAQFRIQKAVTDVWTTSLAALVAAPIPADISIKALVALVALILVNAVRRAWYQWLDEVYAPA